MAEDIHDAVLREEAAHLVGRSPAVETQEDTGLGFGLVDVPHLGLTRKALACGGIVVGMDLHGEVVVDVDELAEEGEGVAVEVVDPAAEEFVHVYLDGFLQRVTAEETISYDRLVAAAGRKHPTLAAPNLGQDDRLKEQRI
jgi:hypothetical protein